MVLGYIDPDRFLDGEIRLDVDAARRAVHDKVAEPLGLGLDAAALAIITVQVANIVAGIRKVSVEAGKDPREHALMPFGGAGGLFAGLVAEEAGIDRVLLPPHASVLSALGMLMTDMRHDRSVTRLVPLGAGDPLEIRSVFADLAAAASEDLARERIGEAERRFEFACDMRYEGQSYEITVPVGAGTTAPDIDLAGLRQAFDAAHLALYGQASPDEPVEIVSFRVGGIGEVETVALPELGGAAHHPVAGRRRVLFSQADGWTECPVHDRAGLAIGERIAGPAIVEDRGASIPLRPGHVATVGARGVVHIDVTRGGTEAVPGPKEAVG